MKHPRTDYDRRIQDSANLIPSDEPVFLLRAQDMLAADAVDFWADALESNDGDPDTVEAVRDWAQRMRAWNPKKMPDTPHELLHDDASLVDFGEHSMTSGAEIYSGTEGDPE